jgi:hypothetical protein
MHDLRGGQFAGLFRCNSEKKMFGAVRKLTARPKIDRPNQPFS